MRRPPLLIAATAAVATSAALMAPSATAATPTDSSDLRDAVTVDGIRDHQQELQDIADANGGTRASGSTGYDESADYVADKLLAAGYEVRTQEFDFAFFSENSPATFARTDVTKTYTLVDDFLTMEYSGSGAVTDVQVVPTNDIQIPPGATANSSTSGCEASDFPASTTDSVALVQRGSCSFAQKAQNAEAAGAVAVIIFNEGQEGRTATINGTLGGPGVTIPVLGASFAVGSELYGAVGSNMPRVSITTDTTSETRRTSNVIADTPTGRTDRTVVVGAHLDSVPEGPGINDNGSGSATILEIALQMAELGIDPTNQVRFAFWGAEESGLVGSEYYVSQLSKRQIKNIAVNLNFDMVGSPNYVRFVYDGDGSDTAVAGPNGSGNVEKVFTKYFASQNLAYEPTEFSGRSDYGPFIAVGIPAGGLFTGAEGVKTPEQVAVYGGTAGEQYDPCYHLACDTFDNVSLQALDEMSDAAAHAVLTFGMTTSAVNGTSKASSKSLDSFEFRGSHRQR